MAKKQEEFALTRFNPGPTSITPAQNFRITKAEQRGAIETRKQLAAIEQERLKQFKAHQAIGDISYSQFSTYTNTAERMWTVKQQSRPAELQGYIDRAFDQAAQRCGAYLEAASDVGAEQVIRVVQIPTYSATTWRPRGFFRRGLDDE